MVESLLDTKGHLVKIFWVYNTTGGLSIYKRTSSSYRTPLEETTGATLKDCRYMRARTGLRCMQVNLKVLKTPRRSLIPCEDIQNALNLFKTSWMPFRYWTLKPPECLLYIENLWKIFWKKAFSDGLVLRTYREPSQSSQNLNWSNSRHRSLSQCLEVFMIWKNSYGLRSVEGPPK